MTDVLVRILVDQLCFLELSASDVLNEDSAVQQAESIVSELESLTKDDRQQLLVLLQSEAAEAKATGQPAATIAFIESLPDGLGLDERVSDPNGLKSGY